MYRRLLAANSTAAVRPYMEKGPSYGVGDDSENWTFCVGLGIKQ